MPGIYSDKTVSDLKTKDAVQLKEEEMAAANFREPKKQS
jgi:hypothetical protein